MVRDTGIGFARAGDKTGKLTNRQCRKCGGKTCIKDNRFYCHRCGPQPVASGGRIFDSEI